MSKNWFSMNSGRKSGVAEISIYSDIGDWGITAKEFNTALNALGTPRELRITISSNGGEVHQGFAIYNMLERHSAKKIVTIDGVAASMASVIAMAGDEVVMPSNSMLMIHNPWGGVTGGADEVISFGEALAKMRDAIAGVYAKRSGIECSEVLGMMDRETWLSAEEAVSLGLADRVEEPRQMAALIDTNKFRNTPVALKKVTADWKPRTLEEIRIKAFQKWNSSWAGGRDA